MKEFVLDKTKWDKVQLGELAEEISEREDNPAESGYERFVGLEHFVSGDLKIKQWATTKNLVSAAKVFKAGDVLFARRNAYLRRASMVDFAGICSGDAFVLRENHEKIVPGVLTFILNSDQLWDYANANAAGTMSKRVKWRDLANYKLQLPPKDQQATFAKLLWTGDKVLEHYANLRSHQTSVVNSFFDTVYKQPGLKYLPLGECLEFSQYGISDQLSDEGDIPVLRMNNLQDKKVVMSDLKYISYSLLKNIDNLLLKKGDILFNRTNSFELVGKVGLFNISEEVTFASYLIRLRVNSGIVLPEYLNQYLNSEKGQTSIRIHRTPGVSQSNINVENLKKIRIPIVSKDVQLKLISKIDLLESAISKTEFAIKGAHSFQKQLINQIFSA